MPPHIVKAFDAEIDTLNQKIMAMAKACEGQLSLATQAFDNLDVQLSARVVKDDALINRFQREIENDSITLLSRRQPVAEDLRYLLSAMKITSELERIGDYAASIAKRVTRLSQKPFREAVELIIEMALICHQMINDSMDAFLTLNIEKAVFVWQEDNTIDRKFARMMTLIRDQMQADHNAIDDGTQLIFIGRCCERIGDHSTNIAEDIYYMATGKNYMDRF